MSRDDDPALVEALAALEHDRWSRWEKYRESVDGPEKQAMWRRKRETPYAMLTREEQESDRDEARRTLGVLRGLDPEDSPIVRHVLYTNDVIRFLGTVVAGLLTVARPDRVRAALEHVLENFDARHVPMSKAMARQHEKRTGEPSGWPREDENDG